MEITVKPGQVIDGRYRLEHPIGAGGYGTVWKAWHEVMNVPLAVKVVNTEKLDRQSLERVKRECRIGGQLAQQVHVVNVRDALEEGGHLFIVMELAGGGTLKAYLRDHPKVDFELVLTWAQDLCEALAAVHRQGVIHRDIKPQNILLTDEGDVKLTDFGIAHLPESELTTEVQPGSLAYRSPEQEANQAVGSETDVYSLCAVLFEAWTGTRFHPYRALPAAELRAETETRLRQQYPGQPSQVLETLADALVDGLERVPGQRASLAQLKAGLKEVKAALETTAPPAARRKSVDQAREDVAQEVRKPRPPTVVSSVIQPPVAAKSKAAEDTALTKWLEQEFGEWFLQREVNDIVLWYDPERQWEPLLPHFSERFPLLRYDGSLLEVRYRLEKRGEEENCVVYLPMEKEEADYLKPYEFVSQPFDDSIYQVLTKRGVSFLDDREERRWIVDRLPHLAVASVGQGEVFWNEAMQSREKANELLLGGRFQEQVLQFLARPARAWGELEATGLVDSFLHEVSSRFGYDREAKTSTEFAEGLLSHLCIVDLYRKAGTPADFPLSNLLPDVIYWNRCQSLLDTFKHHTRYQDAFMDLVRQVEARYDRLEDWAASLDEPISDPPFPRLAEQQWRLAEGALEALAGFDEVEAYLRENQRRIREAAGSFWAQRGVVRGWSILDAAQQVILPAGEAVDQAEALAGDLEGLLGRYIQDWWRIDAAYRDYRVAVDEAMSRYDALTRWVARFYRRFLVKVNTSWSACLEDQPTWPPTGSIRSQTSLWQQVASGSAQRRAVFFVDALRYEMGASIQEALKGRTVDLEAGLATLPARTATGMSALLPGAEERRVDWADGWQITIGAEDLNLAAKNDRKQWLTRQLGEVAFMELGQLLQPGSERAFEDAPWLIVFTRDLDQWGETAGKSGPTVFGELVEQIVQGVRRLLQGGFDEVHILTDHGFLLLDEGEKPVSAGDVASLKKSPRFLIGRDLPETDKFLRFPVPGSTDLVGWFPHGVVCFKAAGGYQYVHGGPALQEIIIPVITVRQDVKRRPVKVELETALQIHSGIFKVTLKPPSQKDFLAEARDVRLAIERESGELIRETHEVVTPEEPVIKNLRLLPTDGVSQGDTIRVAVYDAGTGQELDVQPVQVMVDLEL